MTKVITMNEKEYTLPGDVRLTVDFESLSADEKDEILKLIKHIKSQRGD